MTLCSAVTGFPGGVGSAVSWLSGHALLGVLHCQLRAWCLIWFLIPLKSEESGTAA